jgi:hypothetical protein
MGIKKYGAYRIVPVVAVVAALLLVALPISASAETKANNLDFDMGVSLGERMCPTLPDACTCIHCGRSQFGNRSGMGRGGRQEKNLARLARLERAASCLQIRKGQGEKRRGTVPPDGLICGSSDYVPKGLLGEDSPPEDWFDELEQLNRKGSPLVPRRGRDKGLPHDSHINDRMIYGL